ncbi:hypothetical protein FZW96_04790 [Bacillus sp. BGMRC 2118]|nr:hypothetical protein FZW96_04790 [Bacillus sp. BGMRC 2118]
MASSFIKIVSTLFIATIVLFSVSQVSEAVYNSTNPDKQPFSEGTFVGSLDISGMSKQQAVQALSSEIIAWGTQSPIVLSYNDQTKQLSQDTFTFLIDQTVESVKDGVVNELSVSVKEEQLVSEVTEMIKPLPMVAINKTDLVQELASHASFLSRDVTLPLMEFISQEAVTQEVISETTIAKIPSTIMADHTQLWSTIVIPAKSEFSLQEFLKDKNITDEASQVLASAIYQSVLPTNFEIVERHQGTSLPSYIELGYEASVSETLDFIVYNPNPTNYEIHFEHSNQSLKTILKGLPFSYEYKIEVKDTATLKPKTLVQWDAKLPIGIIRIPDQGKDGVTATVVKTKRTSSGEVLDETIISQEYYPPSPKIEIHSLRAKTENSTDTDTTDTQSDNNTEQSDTDEETEQTETNEKGTTDTTTTEEEVIEK